MKNNGIVIQPYKTKIKQINFRNIGNNNFFLLKNKTLNNSNKINNLSRNNFNKTKYFLKPSFSAKIDLLKSIELIKNNKKNNNHIHSCLNNKKNNSKSCQNIRTILINNNTDRVPFNYRIKNSKIKVNHGMNTNNSYFHRNKNKTNSNFRTLSFKNSIKKININDINEMWFSIMKNKFNKNKKENFFNRFKKDKYAYIYLNDNSESIKFSRRIKICSFIY